jgi:hypothetical protein
MPQPRAFGSLKSIETLDLVSNYYLVTFFAVTTLTELPGREEGGSPYELTFSPTHPLKLLQNNNVDTMLK